MAFDWYNAADTALAGTANDLTTTAGTASAAVELHAWLNNGSSVGTPETRYLRVYVEDPAAPGTYKTSGLDILDRREFEIRIIGSQNPDVVAGFVCPTTAWTAVGTGRGFQLPAIYPNCAIEIEVRVNPTYEGGSSSPATFYVKAVLGTAPAVMVTEASVLHLPIKAPARLVALAPVTFPSATTNGDFATVLTPWYAGSGWAQSAGMALHTAGSVDALVHDLAVIAGVTYRITVTVSGTAGTVTPYIGSDAGSSIAAGAGATTQEILATGGGADNIAFAPTTDFDGAIDNVLVEELYRGIPDNVGGQVVAAGDVLLIAAEVDGTKDGLFTVVDSGPWTRRLDAADAAGLYAGVEVYVKAGTGGRTKYIQTAEIADLATDPQTWEVLIAL